MLESTIVSEYYKAPLLYVYEMQVCDQLLWQCHNHALTSMHILNRSCIFILFGLCKIA